MSYTKITTGFKDHETVLTAAHLQHMENGISDNDSALGNRVRTDVSNQGLSAAQKNNARMNIDTPSTADMNAAVAAEADLRSAAEATMETKIDGIQEEVDQTKEDITDLQAVSSSMVKMKTVKGNPITIKDALAGKVKKLTISLEPKQDLHGYDIPWVGGSGKNLLPSGIGNGSYAGLTWTTNSDGSVTLDGTTTEQVWNKLYFTKDLTLKTGTYRFLMSGASVNARMTFQIANKAENDQLFGTSGSDNTFTVTSDYVNNMVARFIVPAGKTFAKETFFPMIMIATEPNTNYEPYANVCPIEGFDVVEVVSTGKNLINHSALITGKGINGSGEIVTSGGYAISPLIPANPNSQYTFSLQTTDSGSSSWERRVHAYDAQGKWLSQVGNIRNTTTVGIRYSTSFSTSADTRYLRVSYAATFGTDIDGQLELGSIANSYEPFGSTLSLNLVSSVGSTVYGGTVTLNEDGSGMLVVDRGLVTIDNFLNLSSATQISGLHWADTTQNVFDINVNADSICSMLSDRKDGNAGWGSMTDCFALGTPGLRIYTTETTNAAFREKYKDVQITYGFNTPLVYQLTATQLQTLLDTNHIWTNGTSLELNYYAEKYGNADKLLAAFPKETVTGNPASFTDGADGISVESLTVTIEPKQDLHGYEHPWVGGAGKNLLHSFTNKSFSVTGITINTLDDGSLWATGTATDVVEASFVRVPRDTTKTYFINGCPSGGSTSTYRVIVRMFEGNLMVGTLSDTGNGLVIPPSEQPTATEMRVGIWFANGYTSTGMNFKPMVIVGSSAVPYEPYENVCPITGWNTIWLGENLYHKNNVLLGKNWINQTAANRAAVFFQMKKGVKYNYHLVYHGSNNLGVVYGENAAIGQGQTFSWNSGMAVGTLNEHTVTNTNAFFQFQWNDGGRTDPVQWSDINDWEIVISEVSENATSQTIPVKSICGSTVCGGKLTINDDGSGELISEWIYGVLPVCGTVGSSGIAGSSGKYGVFNVSSLPQLDATQNTVNIVFDSMGSTTLANRGTAWFGYVNDEDTIGCFLPSNYTVEDATAALAGTHFAARLKSPTTYLLTAQQVTTLLGTNHITCDAGEVSVTYRADPSLLINKLVSAMTAYGITV